MAALVQPYPQQSTVTMLQARPASSGGHFSQNTRSHQRGTSMPRNMYNSDGSGSYRGQTMTTPAVAPYAFTKTPALGNATNSTRPHPTGLRSENRTISAPAVASAFNDTGSKPSLGSLPDVDTSAIFSPFDGSSWDTSDITSPSRSLPALDVSQTTNKPVPNRYRQNQKRSETGNSTSGSQNLISDSAPGAPSGRVGDLSGQNNHEVIRTTSSPSLMPALDVRRSMSKDDSELDKRTSKQAKRYSRRSIASVAADDGRLPSEPRIQNPPPPPIRTYASVASAPYVPERKEHRPFAQPQRPTSSHGRNESDESISSSQSNSRPSSKRDGSSAAASPALIIPSRQETKPVVVPPRGSSDTTKRINAPSPLSKPMAAGPNSNESKATFASVVAGSTAQTREQSATATKLSDSPAAQQLAALNKKEAKKDGKSSRLRRAFSFGSAAELRKASAENSHTNNVAERAKLHKDQYKDEEEAREAAIVQQQEASGLGASIYSGQGNFFTGSTDNLSISSTASSASIMLRKMGKGVKKTSRSLVGLFRPKSVIGVPAADASLPEPSIAAVSMVVVEAEREKVNVNLDPHDQVGGGTGFPKLERNSLDAAAANRPGRSHSIGDRSDSNRGRPSIVGSEKERAEVLAAVRKGILKRHGTDSANSSPRQRPLDMSLPSVSRFNDSPHSSAPSTPVDDSGKGHRRTDSVTIEGEDYFVSVARFGGIENKSLPGTPRSNASRNISFSPRIQFHDTWPSGEYDRRGEIATCNRLTPTLAQAIKEELNTFKMEMEVHESSKVYTHFF